jgi:hypothetical protein
MGFYDELDKEAGIVSYDSLDEEAGIAPVPTATDMLKQETARTQAIKQAVDTETPDAAERERKTREMAMPRMMRRLPGRFNQAMAKTPEVGKGDEDRFKDELRAIKQAPVSPEQKVDAVADVTSKRLSEKMDIFQQIVQTPYDMQAMIEDYKQQGTRGKKMSRRFDRGVAMVVGGGAHLLEEIQKAAPSGSTGEAAGDTAQAMHKLLQSSAMQPRVDDMVDKYLGGAIESGPFMMAAMAPAVLTGGGAAATLGSYAVAYGVEGNSIYQDNIDAGRSERESRLRGFVGGTLSAGVEVLGGSGGKYFESAGAKVVGKIAKTRRVTYSVLKNAMKEGLVEELPQEVIGLVMGGPPPLDARGSVDYDAIASQLTDAALIGMFTGGLVDATVRSVSGVNQALKPGPTEADGTAAQVGADDTAPADTTIPPISSMKIDTSPEAVGQPQAGARPGAALAPGTPTVSLDEQAAAKKLGMDVEQYRDMFYTGPVVDQDLDTKDATVAESLGMTLEEAREATPKVEPGKLTAKDLLVAPLKKGNKEGDLTPTERLNRKETQGLWAKIRKTGHNANDTLTSMERFLERIDGQKNGPNYRFFMRLRDFSYARKESTQNVVLDAEGDLKTKGFKSEWMADRETIRPGLELTTAQKMGVAMLAKNDKGRRNLIQGMKLTEAEVDGMFASLTQAQQQLIKHMEAAYEAQWPLILEAAQAAGIDPETLVKEEWYSPAIRTDVDPSEQHDMTTMLLAPFTQETHMPDRRMLEERQNVAGEVELDAVSMFLQNLAKVEAFKIMAPLAADLNKVTSDQNFIKHLNRATYGEGGRMLNKWIADSIRGQSVDSTQMVARISRHFRHSSMVYLLNHNVLISSKQWISIFQAMAADKNVSAAMMKNLPRLTKDYAGLRAEVQQKSRMVRVRDFDREFQRKVDKESIERSMTGKKRRDENAVSWIKTVDGVTVILTWKALYDVAISKGKAEAEAIRYADKWVARTQPMGDAVDLPDFFRGGELAKTLTSFGRMPNQVYNLVAHDIIGAKKRGEITSTEAARRTLVGLVIPALIFGLMKRGRPQKDWKELAEDIALYPIGMVAVVGSWAVSAYEGFDQSFIAMLPFQELVKAAKAAVKGDPKKFIIHALKTGGAATGRIGTQAIRTGEGVYDIATGQTRDPRRLLYSEYALTGGKKQPSGESSGSARRPRRAARKRPPSRRK